MDAREYAASGRSVTVDRCDLSALLPESRSRTRAITPAEALQTASDSLLVLVGTLRQRRFAGAKTVDGQRSRAAQDQRDQSRNVKEVDFVTGRAELWSVFGQSDRVDGAEAVLQVHGEHRHEHHD